MEINRKEKKDLSYPGNVNIPGCKNSMVPKYSQHLKMLYNIPGHKNSPNSWGYGFLQQFQVEIQL